MVWVCTAVSDCQIIRRQCRSEWLEHVEQVYQSIIKHGVLRQAPTIAEAAIQVRIMENDITLTKKRKKTVFSPHADCPGLGCSVVHVGMSVAIVNDLFNEVWSVADIFIPTFSACFENPVMFVII